MASVAVDHGLWDAAQQLMHHGGLVLLGDVVESFLNDMATKGVHAEGERVATNSLCDANDLLRSSVLKAALDQKVAKAVNHQ